MFIYCADTYCDDCGREIISQCFNDGTVRAMTLGGSDINDESTFDSDEFPKGPYDYEESDCPQHCANCHVFLENPLTTDGADYVREAVREDVDSGCLGSVACTEWMPYYDYIDYGGVGSCDCCDELAVLDDEGFCDGCTSGPCQEDFTITPAGRLGGMSALGRVGGEFIGWFHSDDQALCEAKRIMTEEQFFPNIWFVSDHGNWTVYTGGSPCDDCNCPDGCAGCEVAVDGLD